MPVSLKSVGDLRQKPALIERYLRHQQHVWRIAFLFGRERTSGVVQPACRPITSSTNTWVEVRLIAARSNAASRSEVARYFAAEPNPGEQSVMARSLSTVLGIPAHTIGSPSSSANLADLIRGVLRVTATIVEKETDVVRTEHFDQALVLSAVLVIDPSL